MRRKYVVVLVILSLVAVALAAYYSKSGGGVPAAVFGIAEIERGDLVATVSATGTLNPLVTVQVGSQVSGTIQRLHSDFNDRVKRGELIAEIEPSLFEAARAQAEANLKSAEAVVEKAAVLERDAQVQLGRLLTLSKSNVVSASELDAANFALDAARAEERVQQAILAQRAAALDQARVNLAHTRIYAPIDGVVISRDVDAGQTVAANLQTPTLFIIAQGLGRMQIETQVDEAYIGKIAEGQPVGFSVFAYPERSFEGVLTQVRLNPTVESGVVKYNCIIQVENGDHSLKPGMTATVAIEVERREDVLHVPNPALRYVPDPLPEEAMALREKLSRHEAIVWISRGGDLLPRVVETGLVSEERTEVRGQGIEAGAQIAVPATKKDIEDRRGRRRGVRLF